MKTMWINCEEYPEPINLNIVLEFYKGIADTGDMFYIEFENAYKNILWFFRTEFRRNEIYSKIFNMLNIKTL